jgi:oxygen-independent coproporphyrinogen-3 oxidase
MLGLRTQWGIDIEELELKFGKQNSTYFQQEIQKYIAEGKVEFTHPIYRLSNQGKLFADGIAGDLFL